MQDHEPTAHDDIAARPNRLPWPPIIYTGAFALCWVLHEAAPLASLDAILTGAPKWLGLGLAGSGFMLDLLAMSALVRHRTAILPNMGSSALVSSGVFAYTRNPIYLADRLRHSASLGLAAAGRADHGYRGDTPRHRAGGKAPVSAFRRRVERLRGARASLAIADQFAGR